MQVIVFAVAGYNLAETGRMLEIATACRDKADILFLSYGGQYEKLIEEQGFTFRKMEPRLTEQQLDHVRRALTGETLNTVGYFTAEEMEPRVENEIKLFRAVQPACVVTGWCQSILISARVSGIPLVNVLHSTSITEYYQAGLQSWPDRTNFRFLRWFLSEETMNRITSKLVLALSIPAKPFNTLGKKYGLEEFRNFIEVLEGDYTLLADIPEWVGFKELRPNVHYIGPLPYRSGNQIPDAVANISRDKPVIFFAMGSSGKPELIQKIIEGFKGKPYSIIAPVKALIKNRNVNVPANVTVTGFLPAHKVNPIADISVIHGGQNTVMQACLAGTPIVGIGMHPEQQANLDVCVRKGFAIRLNKKRVTAPDVHEAIERLLNDSDAKAAVLKFKSQLEQWNGPENAARFLSDTFSDGER